jgi:molybdate transport system substrate-binding protein
MKLKPLVQRLALFWIAVLLVSQSASAADIRVMISAGFYEVYSELGPPFERETGNHLITTRSPSPAG